MDIVKMEVREAGDGAAAGECVQTPTKKYTWAEVRQAVHDLRKELSANSTMVPMAISFRKLPSGKTRVYFLRTPQNGWEITLLYTDITPSMQPNFARFVSMLLFRFIDSVRCNFASFKFNPLTDLVLIHIHKNCLWS